MSTCEVEMISAARPNRSSNLTGNSLTCQREQRKRTTEHDAVDRHHGEDSRDDENQKVARCAIDSKVPGALCNSSVAGCDSRSNREKIGLTEFCSGQLLFLTRRPFAVASSSMLKAATEGQSLKLIFRRVQISGPELCAQALICEIVWT